MRIRGSLRLLPALLALGAACGDDARPADGGGEPADAAPRDGATDAHDPDSATDAGPTCACLPGVHGEAIFLLSADGEVWRFDPRTHEFAFVVGPVCAGQRPFSMAVDGSGVAWINLVDSLSVVTLDLLGAGGCEPSVYERRDPDFGLFGMSFASASATDPCADLYVMTYSGEGPFREGPGLGQLGVIDPRTGNLRAVGRLDFDGGELTGTGDGRLFAFAGAEPAKLVELDKASGAARRTIPLPGLHRTNASAAAFFGGDIYLFTEAVPAGCTACLDTECGDALVACRRDATCAEHLACVLHTQAFSDECGGGLSEAMAACVPRCEPCTRGSAARTSRVLVYDLDGSDGGSLEEIVTEGPIRVVGAASSPCVPVGPI